MKSSRPHFEQNIRGGAIMLVAVGSFSLMDAGLKVLSSTYPPLQITALRSLASLPLVLIWIALTSGFRGLLRARFPLHALRAVLGIIMLVTFVYGVHHLPLAETYAIFFIAPLLITAFAALILRERIEWQRWAAIVIGLGGVLIVLRPTGAGVATLPGLAVVTCAIGYALSAITVRVLGRTDSTQSMVFWLMVMVGAGAGLLALPDWRAIETQHWKVIAAVAFFGAVGQWAITEAFRIGEASFIAPFEYSALAWGLALDWILWRTTPEARALAGAAVIIASGIYLIRRERDQSQVAIPPDAVCD
jgi:drug/metabolite transporter (DMT)-like permease